MTKTFKLLIILILTLLLSPKVSFAYNHVTPWINSQTGGKYALSEEIARLVYKYCRFPEMTLAIFGKESQFNPRARSGAGAHGLGQIHFRSWRRQLRQFGIYKASDLYNIEKNILATNYVLNILYYENGGNWDRILAKYLGTRSRKYNNSVYKNLRQIKYLKKLEASKKP